MRALFLYCFENLIPFLGNTDASGVKKNCSDTLFLFHFLCTRLLITVIMTYFSIESQQQNVFLCVMCYLWTLYNCALKVTLKGHFKGIIPWKTFRALSFYMLPSRYRTVVDNYYATVYIVTEMIKNLALSKRHPLHVHPESYY